MQIQISLLLCLFITSVVQAQKIYLPNDFSCVFNVKEPPFNAIGDGIADDTEAIQMAIDASNFTDIEQSSVIYFPEGNYKITELLLPQLESNIEKFGPWLIGESRENTIIDGKIDFSIDLDNNDPYKKKPRNAYIENLTITEESEFSLDNSLIKNTISGGNSSTSSSTGYNNLTGDFIFNNSVSSVLLKNDYFREINIDNSNMTISEIYSKHYYNSFRYSQGQISADNISCGGRGVVTTGYNTYLSLKNTNFNHIVDAQTGYVHYKGNYVYANNTYLHPLEEYSIIYGFDDSGLIDLFNIENDTVEILNGYFGYLGNNFIGSSISEIFTDTLLKSKPTDINGMLEIPNRTTPDFEYEQDLDNWVSIADFGADFTDNSDDAAAIQAAINFANANNKTTIYFPGCGTNQNHKYLLEDTVNISGSVQHLIGLGYAAFKGAGFEIENLTSPTLAIQHLYGIDYDFFITQKQNNIETIIEDVIAQINIEGNSVNFINNLDGYLKIDSPNSITYVRGLSTYCLENEENLPNTNIINNGGRLWISGLRSENTNTMVATNNGGKTEIASAMIFWDKLVISNPILFTTHDAGMTMANFVISGFAEEKNNWKIIEHYENSNSISNLFVEDFRTPNSLMLYSAAQEKNCLPNGTKCNDGHTYTFNDEVKDCQCQGTLKQLDIFCPTNHLFSFIDARLNKLNIIPKQQPFNSSPHFYNGNESVEAFDKDVADWILLELRNAEDSTIIEYQKAVLVDKYDDIVDLNGSKGVYFSNLVDGNYFIALHHRNTLSTITNKPVVIKNGSITSYLWGTIVNQENLNFSYADRANFSSLMHPGDFDQNNIINNLDYNIWQNNNAIIHQYVPQDANLDGIVNNLDYNIWFRNRSKLGPALFHD